MEKIKTPLTILSIGFGIAFFDGVFGWGLSDDLYVLVGLVELVSYVWIWKIVLKKESVQ